MRKAVLLLVGLCFFYSPFPAENELDCFQSEELKHLRFNPQLRCDRAKFERSLPFYNPDIRNEELLFPETALYQPVDSELSSTASAWTLMGPEGGNVIALVANPKNKIELLALAQGANNCAIFKSTNLGKKWFKLAELNRNGYDLVIDPKSSNTIYVLGAKQVIKSKDGGKTWQEYKLPKHCYTKYGQLRIDPKNSKILYAAGYFTYSPGTGKTCLAVHKSTNGGQKWQTSKLETVSDFAFGNSVAVDPQNPANVYMGGYYSLNDWDVYRLFRSENAGGSWTDITGKILGAPEAIVIDRSAPRKIYVATSWGIFRSHDYGNFWEKNKGSVSFVCALTIDPANPSILYAGGLYNSYKSKDGGENWTYIGKNLLGYCNILLISSNTIFFGSTAGIFASKNKGVSWKNSYSGLQAVTIRNLKIPPSAAKKIYAKSSGTGLFLSKKFGKKFKLLPNFHVCDDMHDIQVHPKKSDTLFILVGG